MKRKVILMGGKTYVLSLPASWIKKYGIGKSQELEVEEKDNTILISTDKEIGSSKIKNLDFTNFKSRSLLYNYIYAAYITGNEEIKILFKTEEQSKIIKKVIEDLIGFAILSETKNSMILKDVTGSKTEFKPMLRRVFFILNALVTEGLETIEKNDFKELEEVIAKDHNMNKYYLFCLRYLNKNELGSASNNLSTYAFLNSIEAVGDKYSDLYKLLVSMNKKVSLEIISLFEKVNKAFIKVLDLFYVQNQDQFIEGLNDLKKDVPKLREEIKEFIGKPNKENAVIASYLLTIIEGINDSINDLLISSQAY
ncbi:MAG: hypothetical protein KKA65_02555 [Nanoarchaeota archaeon]|nr:hypothetical protein [Nanoarchaeota archaeon]MBU4352742.1 hypothetical protein [Nanoarchaeota archaeon]MBU4456358.1 hypothetical protein [Nanoarchaeota archaeon]MCG2719275.1 AbrB/MazE/SpoVT family DNA-binding domain-containing protein [Nanoarchaeota archaeon]